MRNYGRKVHDDPSWALARQSCERDDIASIAQAVSDTISPEDREDLPEYALDEAIRASSLSVAAYVLDQGAPTGRLQSSNVARAGRKSRAMLELLVARGWDINTRDLTSSLSNNRPLMWHFADDHDTVAWCLEHGAEVVLRGMGPLENDRMTRSQILIPQILGQVAREGSVATYELLRSRGAPLGQRALHFAAESATLVDPSNVNSTDTESQGQPLKDALGLAGRMAMVRHLVEKIGLDVNAHDLPLGTVAGPMSRGTPLC